MDAATPPAEEVVRLLGLLPHPEGGFYRETFRAPAPDGWRGFSTAIYYLLRSGDLSAWHRPRGRRAAAGGGAGRRLAVGEVARLPRTVDARGLHRGPGLPVLRFRDGA